MDIRQISIGVVQIDTRVGDLFNNLEHARELVEAAAKQEHNLFSFPN